ncbi:MAG TPA: XrtA-associated tyrosine autokinase [Burkholderiales bacterium]|nr:XrtA-associated tyrosine autokinase [Burkholderiales bacterium]
MSLIEQAAKRLEELKKTGVEVPDSLGDKAPVESAAKTTMSTPERIAAKLNEAEGSVLKASSPASRGAMDTPSVAPALSNASNNARAGRQITIDVARLAAMGFLTPDAPHSALANEYRVIKRPLLANAQGKSAVPVKNGNLIMVSSAMPGEGKSFSALNLAMSIATELDSTVLLIDADVANPTLLRILGLPPAKGLMDVLTDRSLNVGDVIMRTNVEKLSILPAGMPHQRATELLASDSMTRMLSEMAARYSDRILIFDSPPLLPTTESRVLATHMGQIVVVVEAEITTHGKLKQALSQLETCPVVMTMLNKAPRSEVGQYYGYYGYARATQA